MRGRSREIRRSVALLLAALTMLALFPATASAGVTELITCDASGVVEFTANPPGPAASPWTILGKGSCQGDMNGTYFVDFTGSGTSDTLGRCGGTDFVQNLTLKVTVSLTSFGNPLNSRVTTENWFAPITTMPVATPFLIGDGGLQGAGTILTRIAGNCPPDGSPVAKFIWARRV